MRRAIRTAVAFILVPLFTLGCSTHDEVVLGEYEIAIDTESGLSKFNECPPAEVFDKYDLCSFQEEFHILVKLNSASKTVMHIYAQIKGASFTKSGNNLFELITDQHFGDGGEIETKYRVFDQFEPLFVFVPESGEFDTLEYSYKGKSYYGNSLYSHRVSFLRPYISVSYPIPRPTKSYSNKLFIYSIPFAIDNREYEITFKARYKKEIVFREFELSFPGSP